MTSAFFLLFRVTFARRQEDIPLEIFDDDISGIIVECSGLYGIGNMQLSFSRRVLSALDFEDWRE